VWVERKVLARQGAPDAIARWERGRATGVSRSVTGCQKKNQLRVMKRLTFRKRQYRSGRTVGHRVYADRSVGSRTCEVECQLAID
jgi:hypothetical protein